MRYVLLPTGEKVTVDDADYPSLNKVAWHMSNHYARNTSLGFMHRVLMKPSKNMEVDHINGNTLDNRRKNLRVCSKDQNHQNTKAHGLNTSGYKGVSFNKHVRKWEARIRYGGKKLYIGTFTQSRHAAMAYDLWAKELHKEFASLNFKI